MTVAQGDGKPDIAFSPDGTLKSVELKIMNLRPDGRANQDLIWEQVSLVIKTSEAFKCYILCYRFSFVLQLDTKMAKNVRY